MKRGLTYAEALAYLGIKRRTFDTAWRPRLVAIHQGVTTIFDRQDIDRLFDEFKLEAAGTPVREGAEPAVHNGTWNGRPVNQKGTPIWAKQRGESIPKKTEPGTLTSGGEKIDFASAVSLVMKRQKAG